MDAPKIDRDLMARDLELLTELLTPAIEARMAFLLPLTKLRGVGGLFRSLLKDSPRSMISEGLGSILELPDDELAVLVDGIGRELGAWRGLAPALEPDDAPPLRIAYGHLIEATMGAREAGT